MATRKKAARKGAKVKGRKARKVKAREVLGVTEKIGELASQYGKLIPVVGGYVSLAGDALDKGSEVGKKIAGAAEGKKKGKKKRKKRKGGKRAEQGKQAFVPTGQVLRQIGNPGARAASGGGGDRTGLVAAGVGLAALAALAMGRK